MAKKDTPFHCLIARIMPLMSTAQTLAEKNRVRPQPPDCSCGKFPPLTKASAEFQGPSQFFRTRTVELHGKFPPSEEKNHVVDRKLNKSTGKPLQNEDWSSGERRGEATASSPKHASQNRYQATNEGKNTMTQVSADKNLKKPRNRHRNSPTGDA